MAQRDWDNFGQDVYRLVGAILVDTAEAMLSYMNSSDIIPVDTHNLKDSTGIGVYRDGVLTKFMMPQRAQEPRIYNWTAIWGSDMIDSVLNAGVREYSNGDHIVLFSTMPYAEDVDESYHNKGFFTDVLSTEFEVLLDTIAKQYKNAKT